MRVETSRFGTLEIEEARLIRFPDGLVGMPLDRRWVLLDVAARPPRDGAAPEAAPLRWLQSVDHGDVALVVVDPLAFWAEYRQAWAGLAGALGEAGDARRGEAGRGGLFVLCVAVVPPERPLETTVNLRAPLVVDPVGRLGRQVILEDDRWPLRQPLFRPLEPPGPPGPPATGPGRTAAADRPSC